MKSYKIIFSALALGIMTLTSCNDFLDEMPDNRTSIDTEEKVQKLLVTAYPESQYIKITETSSDNIDDYGKNNPYGDRFDEQLAYWIDVTESDNEDPKSVWEALYAAIGSANMALQSIEEMGSPASLMPYKGEALICRAYAHFILVNVFAKHYNAATSATDLGVTYMSAPESTLNPKYERESVADIYAKIDKDIKAGLPLIDDAVYTVPKYHFNKRAAYAFATRFALYYEKWDEVISYAEVALTSTPAAMLRDYAALGGLTNDFQVRANAYVSSSEKSNLLLLTGYSSLGRFFGNYYDGSRFNHGSLISMYETIRATGPWGAYATNRYYCPASNYSSTNLNKSLFPKIPYLFEYTDPVSGTGYRRSVFVAFDTDEVLLSRAEAYVMKKEYNKAVADLNMWKSNFVRGGVDITRDLINDFYGKMDYYKPLEPTIKKHLNPKFTVEAGEQENFIQCVLHFRRLETMHQGLRWFDVKRYGIEIYRRQIDMNGVPTVKATLISDDNRRAIQIPQDVIDAGYAPNPR